MRWQTTAVLAVVLLALGTFYYVYEIRGGPERAKIEAQKGRLWTVDAADVDEMELKRGAEAVTLKRERDDGEDRGRLPTHRGLLRAAAAGDGDDAAGEHEPRDHDDREQEHELGLVRVEEDGGLPRILGTDRDLILFLREPAHRVQEKVPVALEVQALVRREGRRAVDHDPGLVLGGDGRDRERSLRILGVGLHDAAVELAPVRLARGVVKPDPED